MLSPPVSLVCPLQQDHQDHLKLTGEKERGRLRVPNYQLEKALNPMPDDDDYEDFIDDDHDDDNYENVFDGAFGVDDLAPK